MISLGTRSCAYMGKAVPRVRAGGPEARLLIQDALDPRPCLSGSGRLRPRYQPPTPIGFGDDSLRRMEVRCSPNYVHLVKPSTGGPDEACIAPCAALAADVLPGARPG